MNTYNFIHALLFAGLEERQTYESHCMAVYPAFGRDSPQAFSGIIGAGLLDFLFGPPIVFLKLEHDIAIFFLKLCGHMQVFRGPWVC